MASTETTPKKHRTAEDDLRTAGRLLITLLVLIAATVAGIWFALYLREQTREGDVGGFFSVQSVTVEGNTRYDEAALKAYSGIAVGQSVFRLDKVYAAETLLENFPYIAGVEVLTPTMGEVILRVRETEVLGAVPLEEGWGLVGTNNRLLRVFDADEGRPCRYLRIESVPLLAEKVGDTVLDPESLANVVEVLENAGRYGMSGISSVNVTSRTHVTVTWNHRIDIELGTMIHSDQKFSMAVTIMQRLLSDGNATLSGTLDMSSYSGDDPNKYAGVFLPKEYRRKEE